MKLPQIFLILLLSAVTAFIATHFAPTQQTVAPTLTESAVDRVRRTNELHCGYAVFAPYFVKDPATGTYSGFMYEIMEAIGQQVGIKIVWTAEIGLSDIGTSLDNGKIDAFCSALWAVGKRMRAVDYLDPLAFEPMFVYVREDDHRFDDNIRLIDSPDIGISTIDGEGSSFVIAEEFPKARPVSLSQLSGYPEMFNQVVNKKADVFISSPGGVNVFMQNNPHSLRQLPMPTRVYPVVLGVKYGESGLRDMLNQAQAAAINNGLVQKIIEKYEARKGDFWLTAMPYKSPTP